MSYRTRFLRLTDGSLSWRRFDAILARLKAIHKDTP